MMSRTNNKIAVAKPANGRWSEIRTDSEMILFLCGPGWIRTADRDDKEDGNEAVE